MKIYHIEVPSNLHDWLKAQGNGSLDAGIVRVAHAAGYNPDTPKWTVKQAANIASERGYNVSVCTIGAALRAGNIRGATQPARDWMLDPSGFMEWLLYRYNPRQPPASQK